MPEQVKQYMPYVVGGLVLMAVLYFGLRVVFAAVAPQLVGASMTIAWLVASLVTVAWYATRAEEDA